MLVVSLKTTTQRACIFVTDPLQRVKELLNHAIAKIYYFTLVLFTVSLQRCVRMCTQHAQAHTQLHSTNTTIKCTGVQCVTSGDVCFISSCLEALRKHCPLTWLAWAE